MIRGCISLGEGLFFELGKIVDLSFTIPLLEGSKTSGGNHDCDGSSGDGVDKALLLEIWVQFALGLHFGVRNVEPGCRLFARDKTGVRHMCWGISAKSSFAPDPP